MKLLFFFGGGFKDGFQMLFVIYSPSVLFDSPVGGAEQHTLLFGQNYFLQAMIADWFR